MLFWPTIVVAAFSVPPMRLYVALSPWSSRP